MSTDVSMSVKAPPVVYVLTMGDDYDNAPMENVQGVWVSADAAKGRAEALIAQDVVKGQFRVPPTFTWWQRGELAWVLQDAKTDQAFACVEGFRLERRQPGERRRS